ncbi:MAG: tetratricopeptide repeat protein [Dehalococcoidia bacterium]|nr:tetratricopeptide repeat protein [Dehalococcoidia bacterium]MDW8120259.1 tetratricopeptide repeat protein [Chloroflexota bacterium]
MEKGVLSRRRQQLSKEAIDLALRGQWEQAVAINREILQSFPEDVEAWNRLGRALMELGRYEEATQAYQKVLDISPSNTIARKNLERLKHLQGTQPQVPPSAAPTTVFLEEAGKATTTAVRPQVSREVLLQLDPGDPLDLRVQGNLVSVATAQGLTLGYLEPRIAHRIRTLMEKGDRFSAAVASVGDQRLTVLVRAVATPSGETPFPLSDYPLTQALEEVDLEEETTSPVAEESENPDEGAEETPEEEEAEEGV